MSELEKMEEKRVRELGEKIGYGRMMQLTTSEWRKSLQRKGYPKGSEFVGGPCATMTVSCDCKSRHKCDWCCGTGWLTKKVLEVKKRVEQ